MRETFSVFVRPRINSGVSPYLERLTGITSAILREQGRDFADAYRAFLAFAGGGVCAAFGRDELVFDENMRLYGMTAPAGTPEFRDLRPWFRANGLDTCGLHSCDIAPEARRALRGTAPQRPGRQPLGRGGNEGPRRARRAKPVCRMRRRC